MIHRRLAPAARSAAADAGGRFRFSLTSRSLVLLAAGLVWVIPALVDRRALLLMLGWDAIVLALALLDLSRLPRPSELKVTREWSTPLTIGVPARVRLTLENSGRTTATVSMADYVPPALRRDLLQVHAVAHPSSAAAVGYDVEPRERGDLEIGEVALAWTSAWGLAERWGIAPLTQTVRVYPDLAEGREEAMYLIRSRQIALEKRRTKLSGVSREFESLRDYREGDERRDVCWPVSARRGKLVTKVYQPERSQAVWLLVDAGRLLRARVADRTMLDVTVTAALTIAQVALGSGDRVGLMAYGRRLQHRLAPARGRGHLRTVVEALATVRADGVDADQLSAVSALHVAQKRRA